MTSTLTLQPGMLVNQRYQLVKPLGAGGFAQVWLAQDTFIDHQVALKVFNLQINDDNQGLVATMQRDFLIPAKLNHPHLLRVFHFDRWGDRPFLVMEYCAGGSLTRLLTASEGLSDQSLSQLFREVGAALQHLHEKGIVHQDIKPDNILIAEDGRFVLSDFGISSRLRSTLRATAQQKVFLTMAYAAPERFDRQPQALPASDVFSLGITLFELMTQEVPWLGAGGVALKNGAEIPALPDSCNPAVVALLDRALQLQPAERPLPAEFIALGTHYHLHGNWPDAAREVIPEPEHPTVILPDAIEVPVEEDTPWEPETVPPIQSLAPVPPATPPMPAQRPAGPKNRRPLWIVATLAALVAMGWGYKAHQDRQHFAAAMAAGDALRAAFQYDSAQVSYEAAAAIYPDDSLVQATLAQLRPLTAGLEAFYGARYRDAFTQLEAAAAAGSAEAAYYVGELMFNGMGTPKDERAAYTYTQQALEGDFPLAKWREASSLKDGIVIDMDTLIAADTARARALFIACLPALRHMAQGGDPEAMANLGSMFRSGDGLPENADSSRYWYEQAAGQDYAFGIAQYGSHLMDLGTEDGKRQGVAQFRRAASMGDPGGQFNLGKAFLDGEGVAVNLDSARHWLEAAANQDYFVALFTLAEYYLSGTTNGFPKNTAQAFTYMRRAVAQKEVYAYIQIGQAFATAAAPHRNQDSSVYYLEKAGELGLTAANYHLGKYFYEGTGPYPKNWVQASRYFKTFSQTNAAVASTFLAPMYLNGGHGLAKDRTQAKRYLTIMGNNGHGEASFLMYRMLFADGEGEAAGKWLVKSAKQEYGPAIAEVRRYLSIDQPINY